VSLCCIQTAARRERERKRDELNVIACLSGRPSASDCACRSWLDDVIGLAGTGVSSAMVTVASEVSPASRRGAPYFFRVRSEPHATAAKIKPAPLSASLRIASREMPKSSCATLPVSIAAIAAVVTAMVRSAALPMSGE
jgi:hypothetical protein